jgi:hypothetical protein
MARTKQRTVNWTNKQLQQMHLDLLLNTVYEIGSAEAAHEWLMPHYSAASPYCAFFPPLNHMMNALEIIEEGDYDGMPSFDKKLALKIQQRLANLPKAIVLDTSVVAAKVTDDVNAISGSIQGKVLTAGCTVIIRASVLGEPRASGDRRFKCSGGGSGCALDKIGTAIFGVYADGTEGRIRRPAIEGFAVNELLAFPAQGSGSIN